MSKTGTYYIDWRPDHVDELCSFLAKLGANKCDRYYGYFKLRTASPLLSRKGLARFLLDYVDDLARIVLNSSHVSSFGNSSQGVCLRYVSI